MFKTGTASKTMVPLNDVTFMTLVLLLILQPLALDVAMKNSERAFVVRF